MPRATTPPPTTKQATNRLYDHGSYSIERGSFGPDHGIGWAIWQDRQIVDVYPTLKAARRGVQQMATAAVMRLARALAGTS